MYLYSLCTLLQEGERVKTTKKEKWGQRKITKVTYTLIQSRWSNDLEDINAKQYGPPPSFWLCHSACGILVPWPGIEPMPPAMEVWSLNHWTARKSLRRACLDKKYEYGFCLREMIVTLSIWHFWLFKDFYYLIACTEIETIHIEKRSLDLQYFTQAEETIYLQWWTVSKREDNSRCMKDSPRITPKDQEWA